MSFLSGFNDWFDKNITQPAMRFISGSSHVLKFEDNDSTGKFINTIIAPITDMVGLDITHTTSNTTKQLNALRGALNEYSNSIARGYETYVDRAHIPKESIDTSDYEAILNEALSRQNEFGRFMAGYAPFSTAQKMVETRYHTLSKAVNKAQEALTAANAANQQIADYNAKAQAEVDRINAAGRAAAERKNADIAAKQSAAASTAALIDSLANSPAALKAGESWQSSAKQAIDAANRLINGE